MSIRAFGGGHGPKVDPTPPALDKQFIATSKGDLKFMAINGLDSTTPYLQKYSNKYAHLNDKPLVHYEHIVSGYEGGHAVDEDQLFDEPFGYEQGDDPFDTQGKADYPFLLAFFGAIMLIHFNHWLFTFDKSDFGGKLYHQKLVADELED